MKERCLIVQPKFSLSLSLQESYTLNHVTYMSYEGPQKEQIDTYNYSVKTFVRYGSYKLGKKIHKLPFQKITERLVFLPLHRQVKIKCIHR